MNRSSLTGKVWRIRGEKQSEESVFSAFCRIRNFSKQDLLPPLLSDLANPQSLPGAEASAERIVQAIKKKEKILIFGDFNLDGMSGSAVLFHALKMIGAHVRVRLPSRTEGYGLSRTIYEEAKSKKETLVVTVDCGSKCANAIAFGNELGIGTVVTDHHTLPEQLPPTVALLHPHLGNPTDNTWDITGAGVAFFLAFLLLQKTFPGKNIDAILFPLLELAVLGTVADVGKLTGQNRIITHLGILQLQRTKHPGLKALLASARIRPEEVNAEAIAFFLAPRLNASGRLARPDISFELLVGDPRHSLQYATLLEELNGKRREETDRLVQLAEQEIQDEKAPAFCLFREEFFSGVAGLIAARIAEKYHRPTAILSRSDRPGFLTASCRGPDDFHFSDALSELGHLLERWGGHAAAAGFSIAEEQFPSFREAFLELVKKKRGDFPSDPNMEVDCFLQPEHFFEHDFAEIFSAEPFGAGNNAPLFALPHITLQETRAVGQDKSHLAAEIPHKNGKLSCIAFRFAKVLPEPIRNKPLDLLVSPEIRSWQGKQEVRLKIVDARHPHTE